MKNLPSEKNKFLKNIFVENDIKKHDINDLTYLIKRSEIL